MESSSSVLDSYPDQAEQAGSSQHPSSEGRDVLKDRKKKQQQPRLLLSCSKCRERKVKVRRVSQVPLKSQYIYLRPPVRSHDTMLCVLSARSSSRMSLCSERDDCTGTGAAIARTPQASSRKSAAEGEASQSQVVSFR